MFLRCLVAEFLGTTLLLATVVGSGILLHKIDDGNAAATVIGIAFARGCMLYTLIQMPGRLSAHFNPVVTLVNALRRKLSWSSVAPYITAQVMGAMAAVIMFTSSTCFANPAVTISRILTNTICGIRSTDVPDFIGSELLGGLAAPAFLTWLYHENTAGKTPDVSQIP